jgi:hypothetical protein
MPGFELLPSPIRLWARLQAGRASTGDFQALHSMLDATVHALQMPALQPTTADLFEVCALVNASLAYLELKEISLSNMRIQRCSGSWLAGRPLQVSCNKTKMGRLSARHTWQYREQC